jgi:hypothetical protein
MYAGGVVVGERRIDADVVVNCVGFHRNASTARALCGYAETYNTNFLDRNFIYLADAYIDDDAFNSFFGSSVLEMTRFYIDVYLDFFENATFDEMTRLEGVCKVAIEERAWSDTIAGAEALINAYPRFRELAKKQIERRTANFMESHDLETYIAQNRREWFDIHRALAGADLPEEECLPFVFEKLLEKK